MTSPAEAPSQALARAELEAQLHYGPLVPEPYRVAAARHETEDVVTLTLEPLDAPVADALPGQFNMLTAFGVGEAAISVSGTEDGGRIDHTVRAVGQVSRALCSSRPGSVVGVRGPFGTHWGVDELAGKDALVIAGGIGLAPLRMGVSQLAADPASGGARHLVVLIGARTPNQIVFAEDLRRWRDLGTDVEVTVDAAGPEWGGPVGVVTGLLDTVAFDPAGTVALVCGPEVMIRFSARALVDRGVSPERIRISLERNMQCGVGLCGHCQLGPLLLCRDGPVVDYAGAVPQLLVQHER